MQRATLIIRKPAMRPERAVDTVTLDHRERRSRRGALVGDGGLEFMLDPDRPSALNDGDGLRLEDGRLVLVRAAPQKLVEITAGNPKRLLKIAWHIGLRRAAAEIDDEAIYIEDDPAMVELARGLGGAVRPLERPFRPEGGADDQGGPRQGRDEHDHVPAHGKPGHSHGPGCGHDHP